MQPGEFRDVDAPGGAIDSLMRGGCWRYLKGDGNQQAAVGTCAGAGVSVMSAVHYAMRIEFKMLARVMSESLPQEYPYSVEGAESAVMASDFDDRIDVIPVYLIPICLVRRSGLR